MDIKEIVEAIKKGDIDGADLASKLIKVDGSKDVFENFAARKIETILPEKIKESNSALIEKVEKLTGIKTDGADFDKYLGTVVDQLKKTDGADTAKVKELETQIEALKDKAGYVSKLEQTIEGNKTKYQEQLLLKDNELKGKIMEVNNNVIIRSIDSAFSKLTRNPNIPESVFKLAIEAEKQKMLATAETDSAGNVKFKDGKGGFITNSKMDFASISDVIKSNEAIKPLFGDGAGGGGAGQSIKDSKSGGVKTGPDIKTNSKVFKDGDKLKMEIDKSQFTTKDQFSTYFGQAMKEHGISQNSKDYFELEQQAAELASFKELPRS